MDKSPKLLRAFDPPKSCTLPSRFKRQGVSIVQVCQDLDLVDDAGAQASPLQACG